MATKWLMGGECVQCGYAGEKDDPCPGRDGEGWHEISLCYAQWHVIWNLRIVNSGIFHWIFWTVIWLPAPEIMESKTSDKGDCCMRLSSFHCSESENVFHFHALPLKYPMHPSLCSLFLFRDNCQAMSRSTLKSSIRNCWVHQPGS